MIENRDFTLPSTPTADPNISNLFMQAPAMICMLEGPELKCTLSNPLFTKLFGGRDLVGKTPREVVPELEGQGYFEMLDQVYQTGQTAHVREHPGVADWNNDGQNILKYFDIIYSPYQVEDKTNGVIIFGFEVTEQVLTRQLAERNQLVLKTITDVAPIALWMTDELGKTTFVNRTWITWTGVPLEKQLGEGWTNCIYEEDRERAYAKYLSDIAARELFEVEFRIINTKGNIVWCYASGCPWYRLDGSFGGYAGSCIDISERKEAEEQLRYRHALMVAQSEASPVAMVVVSPESEIISYNSRFITMWNFPQEIIDRKDDKAALQYAATQVVDPEEFINRIQRLYTNFDEIGDHVVTDEVVFRDGRVYERNARKVKGEDGTYYGWAWFFMDITERKQEEQRIKSMLEALPIMAWTTKPNGELNYLNSHWYEYTGQTREEALGSGWANTMPSDTSEDVFKKWAYSLEHKVLYEVESMYRRHDGMYRWHIARAVPIKNEKDEVLYWLGTSTDIHDQKTLSQQLEQIVQERTRELTKANIDLKRSNDELEQFAYIASHDLKEPVRKIQFFNDLLQNPNTKNPETYIKKIQEATSRMRALIDDLLDYSSARRTDNAFRKVDLNKVLEAVKVDLELVINEKQATITYEPLPTIRAIPLQMRQLFYNLLNNALKYSKSDTSPKINITVSSTCSKSIGEYPYLNPKHSYYTISIEDNGIGFESRYSEKVFTIFQRLHSRETYSGTGIGLALCKKVAHNHGGEIYVSSIPDLGSTFYVILPAD